ncbi:MAG: diguanylate cyclase [Thermodesulfovibrionia bacterium]|nr:diguanylate cyclase [Thermodesulfovibrionia bacterium]
MAEKAKSAIFFGKEYRVFLFSISLIIAIFVSGIFLGLYYRNGQLIEEEILTAARGDFNDIALNRNWGSGHSGVYAEKKKVIDPENYLNNPDFESMNGKFYTKVGSTLMTGEIVRFAAIEEMLLFHITSLYPLDQKNLADEFERDALVKFNEGVQEFYRKEVINDRTYFRYMAPLYMKDECLGCHFEQGYRLGEIRGGISLNYNIEHIQAKLKNNNFIILSLAVLTIIFLLGIIYLIVLKLMRKLSQAYKRIEELSIIDELTGLYNRRYLAYRLHEEVNRAQRYGHYLGCIMMDIDHFKKFNDTYGHIFGDLILQKVAAIIRKHCRAEDIIVRYGGEEFVIISPETRVDGVHVLASRIHDLIAEEEIEGPGSEPIRITVSMGIAELFYEEKEIPESEDEIIELADRALYSAKAKGRDRIEVFEELEK